MRKDAGIALMHFGARIDDLFTACCGPKSVWTMGRATLTPGAASIIPGQASLHLQFRDPDEEKLDELQRCAEQLVAQMNDAGSVVVSIEPFSPPIVPAPMDSDFQEHLTQAAKRHAPQAWVSMPSAAVHDAMFLAPEDRVAIW